MVISRKQGRFLATVFLSVQPNYYENCFWDKKPVEKAASRLAQGALTC